MKSLVLKDLFNIGHNAKSMLFILVVFAVALIPFSGVEGYIFVCAILCSMMIIVFLQSKNFDLLEWLGGIYMENKRFEITETAGSVKGFYVVVDKETGVNYLVAKFGAGAGICPLIDKDGKPIVTK